MTLNKWRQPTALILLLTFSPVFAEITIDDDQGTLTLAADGLSISQVRPRVRTTLWETTRVCWIGYLVSRNV